MDRKQVRKIRADIEEALEAVGKRHGLQIEITGGRFDSTSYLPKVVCSELVGGVAQTPERTDFEQLANVYGLKAEHLGARFTHGGKSFTITGLKPRSNRYPVLAKCESNGKTFKFPSGLVATYMRE